MPSTPTAATTETVGDFLEDVALSPIIGNRLKDCGDVIQFQVIEPDAEFTIWWLDDGTAVVDQGTSIASPTVTLSMTMDSLDGVFSGQQTLWGELQRGAWIVEGDGSRIVSVWPLIEFAALSHYPGYVQPIQ